MIHIFKALLLSLALLAPVGAFAQAEALTILAVKSALEDALKAFNNTIVTAGNEVRSTGTSLATNAQNVITDLNGQLGKRLQDTIGQLSGAERQLADDAILLTRQVQQATTAVATQTGEQARQTIADADITAYNASYSLPCRDQTPRIVYMTPTSLRRGTGAPEVRIRGNFLDIGAAPEVTVDGKAAKLISRSRNEMILGIPPEVIAKISDSRSVAISIPVEEARRTNFWVYCYDRNVKVSPPLSQAVLLRPEVSYAIAGSIYGVYDVYEPWSQSFHYSKSDNNHEASYNDTQQFCAPEGFALATPSFASIKVNSANCNSSVGSPQVAGQRCVTVPAHLGGCGVDKVLGQIVNYKGRGWFDYDVTVNARRATPTAFAAYTFNQASADGTQKSFQATHPAAASNPPNAIWRYAVSVDVKEGTRVLRTISAGDGNPNPEGVSTRVANGVVYVNVIE